MPTFLELAKANASISSWKKSGVNRPVKVLSASARAYALKKHSGSSGPMTVRGYVTQEHYLLGKNCTEIEVALGLRPLELGSLCYVYALGRLPKRSEVEFKWFCSHPDGKQYGDDEHKDALVARRDFLEGRRLYNRSQTPVVDFYQPGSWKIPQWQLIADIPVGSLISIVTKTTTF